ncbi:MAG: hypothetical protein KGI11_09840 [Thaumarchaeota archaeon]|nr:hypothetical protein [Nitrososphaerota archaeon]
MKAENVVAIILIAGAGTMSTYFVVSNLWPQTYTTIPHGISCSTELKEFQGNLMLSTRQQVEAIVIANQTLKTFIDDSSYCEFMSIGTLYTGDGSYQILNINLNDTKELTAEVNLHNSSVVSYEFTGLHRNFDSVAYVPVNVILPSLFFGVIAAGIIIYFFIIKRRK